MLQPFFQDVRLVLICHKTRGGGNGSGSGSTRKRSFFMEAEAEAEAVKTKSMVAEAEADPVLKLGSGSGSGSSWLLISESGSGGFFTGQSESGSGSGNNFTASRHSALDHPCLPSIPYFIQRLYVVYSHEDHKDSTKKEKINTVEDNTLNVNESTCSKVMSSLLVVVDQPTTDQPRK